MLMPEQTLHAAKIADDAAILESARSAAEHARLFKFSLGQVVAGITAIVPGLIQQRASQAAAEDREARYHEAGHAVVALVFGIGVEAIHIGRTVGQRDRGHVLLDGRVPLTRQHVENRVTCLLAGNAAASAFGVWSGSSPTDFEEAARLTRLLGFDQAEVRFFLDYCGARAQRLVRENARWIERVAEALLESDTLASADVTALRTDPVEVAA